jgi:hypothetical protein
MDRRWWQTDKYLERTKLISFLLISFSLFSSGVSHAQRSERNLVMTGGDLGYNNIMQGFPEPTTVEKLTGELPLSPVVDTSSRMTDENPIVTFVGRFRSVKRTHRKNVAFEVDILDTGTQHSDLMGYIIDPRSHCVASDRRLRKTYRNLVAEFSHLATKKNYQSTRYLIKGYRFWTPGAKPQLRVSPIVYIQSLSN